MAAALPYIAAVASAASAGAAVYEATKKTSTPQAPKPANQDTAANNANQQADLLRRRKGVLANIYGGASNSSDPQIASQTQLGN